MENEQAIYDKIIAESKKISKTKDGGYDWIDPAVSEQIVGILRERTGILSNEPKVSVYSLLTILEKIVSTESLDNGLRGYYVWWGTRAFMLMKHNILEELNKGLYERLELVLQTGISLFQDVGMLRSAQLLYGLILDLSNKISMNKGGEILTKMEENVEIIYLNEQVMDDPIIADDWYLTNMRGIIVGWRRHNNRGYLEQIKKRMKDKIINLNQSDREGNPNIVRYRKTIHEMIKEEVNYHIFLLDGQNENKLKCRENINLLQISRNKIYEDLDHDIDRTKLH